MSGDPKDAFTEFVSRLSALENLTDREKVSNLPDPRRGSMRGTLRGIQGVMEVLEKVKERVVPNNRYLHLCCLWFSWRAFLPLL